MTESICERNHCGRCCGGEYGSCGGVALLSDGEVEILLDLMQYSFLPVASDDHGKPVYRESTARSEADYAVILLDMQKRGLIRIDYDIPLSNYEYRLYSDCSHFGSIALTRHGQGVAAQIEIQG